MRNRDKLEKKEKWVEDIKNSAPADCVIFLIGNKSDLIDKRQVTYQEGKNKAEELGLLFNEVSAKNGDNILLIFGNISEAIIEQFERSKTEISEIKKNIKSLGTPELKNKREKIKEKKCCL